MDIRMPSLDGVAATERICAERPDTRVLIVTTFDLDEYAYAGLRAGASGFLVKDPPADEMLVAIRGVLLQLRDRVHAVVLAYETGLVRPGHD